MIMTMTILITITRTIIGDNVHRMMINVLNSYVSWLIITIVMDTQYNNNTAILRV
jgi:hypothetical protein